ncbi:MAG TPA: flagellar basal-body MS-ring/collar protein FliF [Burkholderiaceae bacterium]
MAAAEDLTLINPERPPFYQTPFGRNVLLGAGIAGVLVLMAVVWMWTAKEDDRVLYSNVTDRDGGAIIASLTALNIPYKHGEGGVILVPASKVHEARLKLAAQGLPKGGNVGFELMENQKLGVSQFLEQVNFQRATEGNLAETIQQISAVQSVRVHLALPKPQVFVRDQQKPTASVLLTLHQGRALDRGQVIAIVHLVASSVPELTPSNVTVLDQNGNLLSDTDKTGKGLDPNQLKYVMQLQQSVVKQVESIVAPIVGDKNVRAEATADVDFSQIEQAAESYRPNQPPEKATIRSLQTSESLNGTQGASGVPGALTNQPPNPSAAPIEATNSTTASQANGPNSSSRRDATTNFEVDKTVRYSQTAMGGLKRLSVGVVLNYKRTVDKAGKVTIKALTDAEKAQITELVRQAMGFNAERGDSLNVSNIPFEGVDKPEPVPEPVPWWKNKENWDIIIKVGKFLLGALALSYIFFKLLRPLLRPVLRKLDQITSTPEPPPVVEVIETEAEILAKTALQEMEEKMAVGYRENLQMAKNLAKEDPRVVANVIKAWVGTNE